jgi:hypothetical protein
MGPGVSRSGKQVFQFVLSMADDKARKMEMIVQHYSTREVGGLGDRQAQSATRCIGNQKDGQG